MTPGWNPPQAEKQATIVQNGSAWEDFWSGAIVFAFVLTGCLLVLKLAGVL